MELFQAMWLVGLVAGALAAWVVHLTTVAAISHPVDLLASAVAARVVEGAAIGAAGWLVHASRRGESRAAAPVAHGRDAGSRQRGVQRVTADDP